MALSKLLSTGLKIASKATKSVQATILFRPWIPSGEGMQGEGKFGQQRRLRAIVDKRFQRLEKTDGTYAEVQATLTFLDPITNNGAKGRNEPIDTRDELVMPLGIEGPIVYTNGTYNPDTRQTFGLIVGIG